MIALLAAAQSAQGATGPHGLRTPRPEASAAAGQRDQGRRAVRGRADHGQDERLRPLGRTRQHARVHAADPDRGADDGDRLGRQQRVEMAKAYWASFMLRMAAFAFELRSDALMQRYAMARNSIACSRKRRLSARGASPSS